jgi:hypothetical protein
MLTKLDRRRLNNLFEAIEKANDLAELLEQTDDPALKALATSFVSRLEEISMEVGMELADEEDPHRSWPSGPRD